MSETYLFVGFLQLPRQVEIPTLIYAEFKKLGDYEAIEEAERFFAGMMKASGSYPSGYVLAATLYSGDRIVRKFHCGVPIIVDLSERKIFYDPYPGYGAGAPLPQPIKSVAEFLDGETFTVVEACRLIQGVANGAIRLGLDHNCIWLEIFIGQRSYNYRVICYR